MLIMSLKTRNVTVHEHFFHLFFLNANIFEFEC
jgi:hypothetical protein